MTAPRPHRRPRAIVLIVIDTLRADHVGVYGAPPSATPALDRFAAHSYVFDDASATSSWTRSSIASMFTSRYPGSVGVLGRDDAIPADDVTLAEVLAGGGWLTVGIFSNGNASPAIGFGQGFAHVRWPTLTHGYPGDFQKFSAEGVTAEAIDALRAWRADGGSQPLFLFVHYIDPHDPYLPHPEFTPDPEPPGRFSGARTDLHRLDRLGVLRRTAADVGRIKRLYAGEVSYCDRWIGRLFEEMEALDVMDDALVVVTADHGEGLWDHGRRGHGIDLYQEEIHVPLLVHDAGAGLRAMTRIATPMSLLDLAPTMVRAAGIEPPAAFEGHDLAPLMTGERPAPESSYVYAELNLDGRSFDAFRTGATKMIRRRGFVQSLLHPTELFRLDDDPGEHDDLARSRHWLTRRLTAAADAWAEAIARRAGTRLVVPVPELDPRTREQLRGLGYVE